MKSLETLTVVVLLVALAASLSVATQIEYVSPRQMGDESALVARGKVSEVRSFWNAERTKIFTETTIMLDETYKGQGGASVRVLQLGGDVGTIRMHVHGSLSWRDGEEVLLFLDRMDTGYFRVTGFSQGKFEIERDPVSGEAFVKRPMVEGAEVLGAPARMDGGGSNQPTRTPLDQFVNDALGRK
jgi:hypothetical protein